MPKQQNPKLTDEQRRILFDGGTEAPFTGAYVHHSDAGMFACANCGSELFDSNTKFDSGTGWPSFYDIAKQGAVKLQTDTSHGMSRVEAVCASCDAHLGHVFDDATDQPTGQRYCINSACLQFMPAAKEQANDTQNNAN